MTPDEARALTEKALAEFSQRVVEMRRLLPGASITVAGTGMNQTYGFHYPEISVTVELYAPWPNYISVELPISGSHRRDNVTLERLRAARNITEVL